MTTPAQPPLPAPDQGRVPAPLTVACSLVALEAVSLVIFGVVELRSIETGKLTMGITTSLFFVVYGVGLGRLRLAAAPVGSPGRGRRSCWPS